MRCRQLIDLLVVTLEAGVGFTGALRMAPERLTGPLGDEIRLTIQEQSLGLSMMEALENWLKRCDTPSRALVRPRDGAGRSPRRLDRRRSCATRRSRCARGASTSIEERAQKAPIKILFPLVFLIFPAMFVDHPRAGGLRDRRSR